MRILKPLTIVSVLALARPVPAQTLAADSVVFTLAPASRLEVRTGKAGLLGFAGHEHVIRAHAFSGQVVYYREQPAASHVTITVMAGGLEVVTPPDTAEIRKVTATMRTEVLDIARYPEITFASRTVRQSGDTLYVVGALTLRGQTRDVPGVFRVEIRSDTLRTTGTFTIRQTDFGIRPYRGGPGGTVRVADAVTFTIDAVAVRRDSP